MNKESLMEKYKDEHVLCISNCFIRVGHKDGLTNVKFLLESIKEHGYFDYRYIAEVNFDAKQVIPYVVLKHKDKYFVTERIKGDSRLVGGLSIAVGGHINPCDMKISLDSPIDVVNSCIKRELQEETTIELENIESQTFVTTFVDESSEVSKVHVCLLTVVEVNTDDIEIKEVDKLKGKWMKANEVSDVYDRFEGWSKIAVDLLNIK